MGAVGGAHVAVVKGTDVGAVSAAYVGGVRRVDVGAVRGVNVKGVGGADVGDAHRKRPIQKDATTPVLFSWMRKISVPPHIRQGHVPKWHSRSFITAPLPRIIVRR